MRQDADSLKPVYAYGMMTLHFRAATAAVNGPPLLLVHGWCCDHRAMRPVAAAFPDHDVWLADLPGHGASADSGDYRIASHAAALAEAMPPGCVVVGHSMGGQVALELAARFPEKLAGAVLVDAAHILPSDKVMEAGQALQKQLARHAPADIVRAFARAQLVGPLSGDYDALVDAMAATPAHVARGQWDAILGYDGGPAALARLARPLLAVAIDRPVNRLSDLARASRRVMTGQVAGSGHMVQFEAMDQLAAMMRRWMLLEIS